MYIQTYMNVIFCVHALSSMWASLDNNALFIVIYYY